MSKSDRQRVIEAAYKARLDSLRGKVRVDLNGRELKPGTREYEKELVRLVNMLDPEDLDEITRKPPNA